MTITPVCTAIIQCVNNQTNFEINVANQQAYDRYLVAPNRLYEIIGPTICLLGLLAQVCYSKRMSNQENVIDETELFPLNRTRKITLYDNSQTRNSNHVCGTTFAIPLLLLLMVGGMTGASYISDIKDKQASILVWVNSFTKSSYCKNATLNATKFFIQTIEPMINGIASDCDGAITFSASYAGTLKVIGSVFTLLALGIMYGNDQAINSRKKGFFKYQLLISTIALAVTANLAMGIYQLIISTQVCTGNDLMNGWKKCLGN